MIDVIKIDSDIRIFDTQTSKAANILQTQLGTLFYAADLGIDLKYFLDPDFRFQNESFKAYLVQVLAENSINVSSVIETLDALSSKYTFELSPAETEDSLVAR
jgi:hypothetical protein